MDVRNMIELMQDGMIETVKIFFFTLIFTLPLGMFVAFGRMSKFRIIRYLFKFYIAIMRGTPLMLQLLVVYYGPYFLFKVPLSNYDKFYAVIIGFVLNYAAYFGEIYRSGIEAMPIGQYEAAKVLGYNKVQTFVKIILPQVIKKIIPPVTNEIVTLVKDTSLAFSIAYIEMFSVAKNIASAQTTMTPFIIAGVFYFVFNLLVAFVMGRVEKSLDYYTVK